MDVQGKKALACRHVGRCYPSRRADDAGMSTCGQQLRNALGKKKRERWSTTNDSLTCNGRNEQGGAHSQWTRQGGTARDPVQRLTGCPIPGSAATLHLRPHFDFGEGQAVCHGGTLGCVQEALEVRVHHLAHELVLCRHLRAASRGAGRCPGLRRCWSCLGTKSDLSHRVHDLDGRARGWGWCGAMWKTLATLAPADRAQAKSLTPTLP